MGENELEPALAFARGVCVLLDEYISLHDSFVRQSGFRGLLRAIDFDGLAVRASEVLVGLDQKQAEIDSFRNVADAGQKEFAECLSLYTESLRTAVRLFLNVLRDLIAKREGVRIGYFQHRQNWKRYEAAIVDYRVLGNRLNGLFETLQHSPPVQS